MALTTQAIGVNTVLGAFVAGILIGESPILTAAYRRTAARPHHRSVHAGLLRPVRTFRRCHCAAQSAIWRCLPSALILIASIGKFSGAFIGGKLGGLSRAESLALGCGMNARGSTEVIVATIGLSMGMLNQNLFTLIVTMAVVTTLAMPPMLRWALKRLPLRKKERLRLEREKLDAKGFVTNLERLLLAADDSTNGRSRHGSPARSPVPAAADHGSRFERWSGKKEAKTGRGKENSRRIDQCRRVRRTATIRCRWSRRRRSRDDARSPSGRGKTRYGQVTRRQQVATDTEAVAGEARKGYDLLVVGLAKTRNPKGGFSKDVSRITEGFHGPLAIVDGTARADRAGRPLSAESSFR